MIGLAAFMGPLLAGVGGLTVAGIGSVPYLGAVLAFLGTGAGRVVMMLLAAGGLYLFAFHKGESGARAECEAGALRARLAAKEIDLRVATERAERSQSVINGLMETDAKNRDAIEKLKAELETRPLQSTKPGAKIDANALLDDQCRLTPAGARRLQNLRGR
jgi:hypothetical protein